MEAKEIIIQAKYADFDYLDNVMTLPLLWLIEDIDDEIQSRVASIKKKKKAVKKDHLQVSIEKKLTKEELAFIGWCGNK